MSEYTLAKKSSLEKVADAIRQKGGTTADLIFPDGFVAAILAIETTPPAPPAPTMETLALGFVDGYPFSNSIADYIAVGHNSGHTNRDAVWSFTPSINATSAVFHFVWDNYAGGSTNHGWSGAYDYAFAITTDSSSGMTAQSASGKVVKSMSGASGEVTVQFDGVSLVKGTTYYIRANQNGETVNTLKAFAKAGNTVTLSV